MLINGPSQIHGLLDARRFLNYGTGPSGASGAAPNSAAAQAYFDRLYPYPSAEREQILGAFIDGCVDLGLDSVFDALYICCHTNGGCAQTNVFQSLYQAYEYVAAGSITFYADSHVVSTSILATITSVFNPATAGGLFTRNDAMMGCYIKSTASINAITIFNATDAAPATPLGDIWLSPKYDATNSTSGVNGGYATPTTVPNSSGLFIAQRTASNLQKFYRNGTEFASAADASTALSSAMIRLQPRQEVRLWFFGKSMSAPQIAGFQTLVETLVTDITGGLP